MSVEGQYEQKSVPTSLRFSCPCSPLLPHTTILCLTISTLSPPIYLLCLPMLHQTLHNNDAPSYRSHWPESLFCPLSLLFCLISSSMPRPPPVIPPPPGMAPANTRYLSDPLRSGLGLLTIRVFMLVCVCVCVCVCVDLQEQITHRYG